MTNPEDGRKWFSASVASTLEVQLAMSICSCGACFTRVPVLVCIIKTIHQLMTACQVDSPESVKMPEMMKHCTKVTKYLTKLKETLVNYV